MTQEALKQKITAIDGEINDSENKTVEELREIRAEKLSEAIHHHTKEILSAMLSAAIPIPQDGGTGLKNTMTTYIKTL